MMGCCCGILLVVPPGSSVFGSTVESGKIGESCPVVSPVGISGLSGLLGNAFGKPFGKSAAFLLLFKTTGIVMQIAARIPNIANNAIRNVNLVSLLFSLCNNCILRKARFNLIYGRLEVTRSRRVFLCHNCNAQCCKVS